MKGYSILLAYSAINEDEARAIRKEIIDMLGELRHFDYPRLLEISTPAEIVAPPEEDPEASDA